MIKIKEALKRVGAYVKRIYVYIRGLGVPTRTLVLTLLLTTFINIGLLYMIVYQGGKIYSNHISNMTQIVKGQNTFDSALAIQGVFHADRLDDHAEVLTNHAIVQNAQTDLIMDHNIVINDHAEVLTNHAIVQDAQTEVFNDHAEIFNDHAEIISNQQKRLQRLEEIVNDLQKKLGYDGIRPKGRTES